MATPTVAQEAVGPTFWAQEQRPTARLLAHMILFTGDPLKKIEPVLRKLRREDARDIRVTVVSGRSADADDSNPHNVEVIRFPGESTLHLRTRIPVFAGQAEWVILLEDHNHLDDNWLRNLRCALKEAPAHVGAVAGGADNRTSTDPWSWANFLVVLGFYWAPCSRPPAEPLFFNVAYRRDVFPPHTYGLGEFEMETTEALMSHETSAMPFPVDHVQFRSFPNVFYYHWCNGRMTGAMMRHNKPDGYAHVVRHAKWVAGGRMRLLEDIIRTHPKSGLLPAGTIARVRLLAFCHAMGALVGGLIGYGRAPWALE